MYTATIAITVTTFVPMNGTLSDSPHITATLGNPNDTSPNAPTGVFSGTGESLVVTVPGSYTGAVQLTFQLADPNYVLLGLGFLPNSGGSSRQEFRTVVVNRDATGSQLTVTDACLPGLKNIDFNYVILVQHVASGNIGLIDPDIENETTE